MYTECFVCRRSLGTNSSIPHLAIGRKIAFDPERGRLWVVCPHCGQWCLTPSEERWEAIAECETLFATAEARVSSPNVGLARVHDFDLIRIGPALRDEIANWRYGLRLARRRRRMKVAGGTLAVATGAATGAGVYGVINLALVTGSAAVAAYLGLMAAVYVVQLTGITAWTPITRLHLPHGKHRTLRRSDLPYVWVIGHAGQRPIEVQVLLTNDLAVTYSGDDALFLLARILPHANWRGADEAEIRSATAHVDRAERASAHNRAGYGEAWERLAMVRSGRHAASCPLMSMPLVDRLALEMAVDEELERRAMSGEAAVFGAQWPAEEEIARMADDMFLPGWMSDWMRAARRQLGGGGQRQ